MNTDCPKCGTPMAEVKTPINFAGIPILAEKIKITAYRCEKCGHWNNLKRRKGWKESSL